MAGKRADARQRLRREGVRRGYEQTTGRRRRESPLLLISSAFFTPSLSTSSLALSSLPRRPSRFGFGSRSSLSPFLSLPPSPAFPRSPESRSAATRFPRCGPPYSLRPFNSIATPFYNAVARAARAEVAMAPDLPLRDFAILPRANDDVP